MYRVVEHFTDLKDGGHPYNVGDAYPREGLKVTEERLKELSSTNNKRRIILIKEVEEKPTRVKDDGLTSNTGNAKSKSRKAK